MSHTTKQRNNAYFALQQYNVALQWRWPLTKALNFAASECESYQDIDDLQNLLNEQCYKETLDTAQHIAVRIITRK